MNFFSENEGLRFDRDHFQQAQAQTQTFDQKAHQALRDIVLSFRAWPIFYLFSISQIQSRYRRSSLGQFWVTGSMAITVAALSIVWAVLWRRDLSDFAPHIAVSFIFWQFITGTISDATSSYINAKPYLTETNIPKFTIVISNVLKQIIILGHNSIIIIVVLLIFGIIPARPLDFLLGLLLTIVTMFGITTLMAVIGLRYRDVPTLVGNILQVAFYLTPVLWKADFLPPEYRDYLVFNPFAVFLEILRSPLLGNALSPLYWWVASGWMFITLVLGFILFSRARRRISYWL